MKKLLFFISILSLGACNVFEVPDSNTQVDVSSKTMDQLVVPNNFTFKTTQDIDVTITASNNAGEKLKNVPFQLYAVEKNSTDSVLLLENSLNTEGVFTTKINMTKNIDRLVILTRYAGIPEYSTIPVNSNSISIDLGAENTVRNEFVSGDNAAGFGGGGTSADAVFSYIGEYNGNGVPKYILKKGDVVSASLLNTINRTFLLGKSLPKAYPQYVSPSVRTQISLKEAASVWITFVHANSSYKNSIGYYTYPTNRPPQTAADISNLNIVFPNISFGGLKTGDKVLLGNFPAGISVGWFLVPNGWSSSNKGVIERPNMPIRYSDRNLNTFTTEANRSHMALLKDPDSEKLIFSFEDTERPTGYDEDFDDAIFYVTASKFSALDLTNIPNANNTIVDTDNDGVADNEDAAPLDPTYAYVNYSPAANYYSTLAFEDAFPLTGDYDMNDMVVDYNFEERANSTRKVTQLKATIVLKAMGASFRNGFGFELPVSPTKVASATGMKNKDGIVSMNANGTEAGQSKAVFIAFDNGYSLMSGATNGAFINTDKMTTAIKYDTIRLNITFTEPIDKAVLGTAPYNPFIFVNRERGREIHLPGKTPTSLANATYFKTGDDDSGNGKYYQSKKSLPWAINIVDKFDYPIEKAPINTAFLKFNQWVESNGVEFVDWYKDKSGYRAPNKIY